MDTKRLTAILLLLVTAASASGQMSFWLSTSGDVNNGSEIGETPSIEWPRGGSGEIYIWAKPETDKTLENFSLNIVSTSETAIEFDSAVIANEGRFGSVFDTNHDLDIADQGICVFPAPPHGVWGLTGLSIDPDSGTGLNAAAPGADPNYDASNKTWLLATIGYTALENGSTDLFLEVGQIGMNYEGETASSMNVRLGSVADPVLGNGPLQRCERSATSEATIDVVDPMLGDFNLNGELDANDMDLLSSVVWANTNDVAFELKGMGVVDGVDRVFWVEELKGTNFGDANLDGIVGFEDFLLLSGAFDKAVGWARGDTDGNLFVDFTDFLKLSANFGKGELFESAAAVPEPSGASLACELTLLLLLLGRPPFRR